MAFPARRIKTENPRVFGAVIPEAPTAGPVVVAGLFSAPVTGVPGVTSLDLFTPPPLPRGQDVQGRLQIDAVALTTTVLTIVPTPSVMAAIGVSVPTGSSEGYFQLALIPPRTRFKSRCSRIHSSVNRSISP